MSDRILNALILKFRYVTDGSEASVSGADSPPVFTDVDLQILTFFEIGFLKEIAHHDLLN